MALTILLIGVALGWVADPNRSWPFLASAQTVAIRPAVTVPIAPLPVDLVPKDLATDTLATAPASFTGDASPANATAEDTAPAAPASVTIPAPSTVASAASPAPSAEVPAVKQASRVPLWTVQFGVFRDAANARNTSGRLKRLGVPVVMERQSGRFVLASMPLPQGDANAARQKALSLHLPGVFLSRHH